MSFSSDTRGVSEVLGAIMVFALVLTVLVIVQVAGVPAANQQIEFEHNARVQADFQEFDQSVDQMGVTGAGESITIESGVRYPPRLFLINPGPAAGTVSTGKATDVTFGNVRALNTETAEYFSGSVPYDPGTTSLSYAPTYNQYTSAPTTVYEHGILYNSDDSGTSVFDRGNVVSGNRISLTFIEGDLSTSSTRSVGVPMNAVSGPSQKISITGDVVGGVVQDISIQIHTDLSEDIWRNQILAAELQPNGHVKDVQCLGPANSEESCEDVIEITLDGSQTYDLRLAKIGVGSGYSEEGTKYLTKVGNTNPVINRGGTELTVEARDVFNNGVPGETVIFESDDGKFVKSDNTKVESLEVTTDETGRASVKFEPEIHQTSATITATGEFDGDNSATSPLEVVEYNEMPVETDEQSDLTEDDINPAGDGFVVQRGAQINGTSIDVYLQNQAGGEREIVQARINFYSLGSNSGNNSPSVTNITSNKTNAEDTLDIAGDYVVLSEKITLQDEEWVTLTFEDWEYEMQNGKTQTFDPKDKDFFVLTLFFSNGGDDDPEERGVYFVGAKD